MRNIIPIGIAKNTIPISNIYITINIVFDSCIEAE